VPNSLNSRLRRRREDVIVRKVGHDVLVLDIESDRIHQLNQTAGFIWQRCEEAPSVGEIASLLAIEFDVGHDEAVKDVLETLSRLRELNLIVAE
jgi:Coenzyme PQQ synthesis protein D (PqqD)